MKTSPMTGLFVFCLLCSSAPSSFAQAITTAQRETEITPFIQTVYVQPDYGPYTDSGFTVGVDYSHLTRLFLQPSIEVRITHATGTSITETSYSGGIKLSPNGFRIRPYAEVLVGTGRITFLHPSNSYESDSATIYTVGGGVEMDLPAQFRLRADFAQQFWNCDPLTLTPTVLGIGVSYRIHPRHGVME